MSDRLLGRVVSSDDSSGSYKVLDRIFRQYVEELQKDFVQMDFDERASWLQQQLGAQVFLEEFSRQRT